MINTGASLCDTLVGRYMSVGISTPSTVLYGARRAGRMSLLLEEAIVLEAVVKMGCSELGLEFGAQTWSDHKLGNSRCKYSGLWTICCGNDSGSARALVPPTFVRANPRPAKLKWIINHPHTPPSITRTSRRRFGRTCVTECQSRTQLHVPDLIVLPTTRRVRAEQGTSSVSFLHIPSGFGQYNSPKLRAGAVHIRDYPPSVHIHTKVRG